MAFVIILDIFVVGLLYVAGVTRGFERALPVATFLLILFPNESQIPIPGFLDITTQRLIVFTLIALYFQFGRSPEDGGPVNKLPIAGLLILQIIWMVVATVNSVVFTVSLKSTLSQLLDFFTVFYLYAKGVRSTDTIHRILRGFVGAMLFLSVFAFIEYYFDWSLLSLFPVVGHRFNVNSDIYDRIDRVRTTFGHPILFGGALAMAIPAALYLIRISKSKAGQIGFSLGIGLMFWAIYKTDSRGPWLALLLSCVAMVFFGGKQLRKYLLIIALVVATTLVVRPGIYTSLENMYVATKDPDSPMGSSYQWRYTLYDLVKAQLGKNPARAVWGYGPESFYYLGLTTDFYLDGEVRTVKVESCDSSVAALMMETGYLGFAITALLLLAPLWIAIRGYFAASEDRKPLLVLFICNMGAYFFLMTNVAIYGWGQQTYILWVILAMASIYPTVVKAEAARESESTEPAPLEPAPRVWGTAQALQSGQYQPKWNA
ncbi:MAG TPA: O-antigen ligase family protein [Terracidiphilus sp.]|nr:O-antigen ligase family protein [Terracidiphilus sp.]